jgi:hypothetical protein
MKTILVIITLFITCFCKAQNYTFKISKEEACDSAAITHILIGTWADTLNTEHTITFTNIPARYGCKYIEYGKFEHIWYLIANTKPDCSDPQAITFSMNLMDEGHDILLADQTFKLTKNCTCFKIRYTTYRKQK